MAGVKQQQSAILRARQTSRIEALERVEGRVLLDIEEHIGSCIKWPMHYTEMMLQPHLRFAERFQVLFEQCSSNTVRSLRTQCSKSRDSALHVLPPPRAACDMIDGVAPVSQLTLFLLGNRCPPTLFVEWFIKRSMLRDHAARMHVADLIQQHKTGKLEAAGKTTWIMGTTKSKPLCLRKHKWDGVGDPTDDKVDVVATPSFAFDWEHSSLWDEAVQHLKHDYGTVRKRKKVSLADVTPAKSAKLQDPSRT
jgi:hypothetical protein